jgi:hypothetical protein
MPRSGSARSLNSVVIVSCVPSVWRPRPVRPGRRVRNPPRTVCTARQLLRGLDLAGFARPFSPQVGPLCTIIFRRCPSFFRD